MGHSLINRDNYENDSKVIGLINIYIYIELCKCFIVCSKLRN